MIPSTPLVVLRPEGIYLAPDDISPGLLYDYELGGLALEDASEGLEYQNWVCWFDGASVRAKPVSDTGNGTVLISITGVTRLSFALDLDMRPYVAYTLSDGVSRFYWYNPALPAHTTSVYTGTRTPRVCYDDKRSSSMFTSDIVIAYLKGSDLCYRQQRDNFTVEYTRYTDLPLSARLINVGKTTAHQLQFEIALT